VHAIAHMASPVSLSFTDPEPVIHTAVTGTTSILASALKAGPQLKSVVVISSIAAVASPREPPHTYTEEDWNTFSEGEVERLGKQTPGGQIYRASKTAAERAFWKFREEKKPSFSMTAINPWQVTSPSIDYLL
jgi:nucleoside-diphosphate-sugar epimerase